VNDNVDQMVSGNRRFPEPVIVGKCEIYKTPWGEKPIKGEIMVQVSDRCLILYLGDVIACSPALQFEHQHRFKIFPRIGVARIYSQCFSEISNSPFNIS
jgi:hypothetical protein